MPEKLDTVRCPSSKDHNVSDAALSASSNVCPISERGESTKPGHSEAANLIPQILMGVWANNLDTQHMRLYVGSTSHREGWIIQELE
jgi:hypothetical protein